MGLGLGFVNLGVGLFSVQQLVKISKLSDELRASVPGEGRGRNEAFLEEMLTRLTEIRELVLRGTTSTPHSVKMVLDKLEHNEQVALKEHLFAVSSRWHRCKRILDASSPPQRREYADAGNAGKRADAEAGTADPHTRVDTSLSRHAASLLQAADALQAFARARIPPEPTFAREGVGRGGRCHELKWGPEVSASWGQRVYLLRSLVLGVSAHLEAQLLLACCLPSRERGGAGGGMGEGGGGGGGGGWRSEDLDCGDSLAVLDMIANWALRIVGYCQQGGGRGVSLYECGRGPYVDEVCSPAQVSFDTSRSLLTLAGLF